MGGDAGDALGIFASARFRALHVTRVDGRRAIVRGLRLGDDPRRARPRAGRAARAQRVRIALRVRLLRGPLRTLHFTLRIPRDLARARARAAADRDAGRALEVAGGDVLAILDALFGGGGQPGAQSMGQVSPRFQSLVPLDGVYTRCDGQMRRLPQPRVRIDGARDSAGVASERGRAPTSARVGRILELHG